MRGRVDPANDAIALPAAAKINLALHVTGRRSDGYHLLDTLAVFTEAGDRVSVTPAEADGFAVAGRFAGAVPLDRCNLVLRARDLLRAHFPEAARRPAQIALQKNLPPASGIGGGSSDAAAALRALVGFWNVAIDEAGLARLALPLGADLPMCLAARPLVARGIGEEIEPVPAMPALPMLLVNPAEPVSTQDVFRALRRHENPPLAPLPRQLDLAALVGWLEASRNDLEAPAVELVPVVADVLAALRRSGAPFARMSGSGATCFGVFETVADADGAAARIAAERPGWWVVATQSRPSEVVHARD